MGRVYDLESIFPANDRIEEEKTLVCENCGQETFFILPDCFECATCATPITREGEEGNG